VVSPTLARSLTIVKSLDYVNAATLSIKKRNKEGDKTKMGYFFAILEDRLGLRTA